MVSKRSHRASFEPIRAARFYIHDSDHRDPPPDGTIAVHIDAATAFGTGRHTTTRGCLEAPDRLARANVRLNGVTGLVRVYESAGLNAVAVYAALRSSRIMSAAFSAIMMTGELVLPLVIVGITEASTTRSP